MLFRPATAIDRVFPATRNLHEKSERGDSKSSPRRYMRLCVLYCSMILVTLKSTHKVCMDDVERVPWLSRITPVPATNRPQVAKAPAYRPEAQTAKAAGIPTRSPDPQKRISRQHIKKTKTLSNRPVVNWRAKTRSLPRDCFVRARCCSLPLVAARCCSLLRDCFVRPG